MINRWCKLFIKITKNFKLILNNCKFVKLIYLTIILKIINAIMDNRKILLFCILLFLIHFLFLAFTNDILNRNELSLKPNFNINLLPEKIDRVEYAAAAHSIVSLRLIWFLKLFFFQNSLFPSSNFIGFIFQRANFLLYLLLYYLLQLKSINTTADPCDNFFQYACGRWIQEHPIPDDKSGYGTFVITTNVVRNQMKGKNILNFSLMSLQIHLIFSYAI